MGINFRLLSFNIIQFTSLLYSFWPCNFKNCPHIFLTLFPYLIISLSASPCLRENIIYFPTSLIPHSPALYMIWQQMGHLWKMCRKVNQNHVRLKYSLPKWNSDNQEYLLSKTIVKINFESWHIICFIHRWPWAGLQIWTYSKDIIQTSHFCSFETWIFIVNYGQNASRVEGGAI